MKIGVAPRMAAVGGTVLFAVVMISWLTMSHTAPRPAAANATAGAPASAPAKKWIIATGGEVARAAEADPSAPPEPIHKAPVTVAGGPLAQKLAALVTTVLPDGSKPKSLTEYPELKAATVSFTTADGSVVTVAAQRLKAPMPLSRITHGSTTDKLSETPTGTQLVDVARGLPETMQLVVARPNGTLLTLTVIAAKPEAAITSVNTATPQTVSALARQKFDTPQADAIFE